MANISKIKLPGGSSYDLKDYSAVPKYGLGENILDNWYFPNPVNQRGQNSYSISSFAQDVYTIDRWKIDGSYFTASLTSSGLELTKTNNITSAQFSQHVPLLDTNQTYTFSAIINGELCTATGQPGSTSSIVTYTINNVTFDMRFTSYGSGRYEVQFVFPINEEGTITIKAVKFEVGTEQTLIQTRIGNLYLTENPDYGKELLKCQTSTVDINDSYANKSFTEVEDLIKFRVPVYGMGKNLLDNWYFGNPVNQRGQSSYTGAIYGIDRWANSDNGTINVLSDGVTIASGGLQQWVSDSRIIDGETYTISLFTEYGLKTATGTLSSSASGWQFRTTGGDGGWAAIGQYTSGRYDFRITGGQKNYAAKLELGTEQTLCHNEGTDASPVWVLNDIPNYEDELLKCKTAKDDPSDIYANKVISSNIPNKNLLRNWYFASQPFPINSRGLTSLTAAGYFIDGWRLPSGPNRITASIETGSVRLTRGSQSTGGTLLMKLPQAYSGVLTISALVKANISTLGTGGIRMRDNDSNAYAQKTATRQGTSVELIYATYDGSANPIAAVEIYLTSAVAENDYMDVYAIKLECGTEQTLAHIENGEWVLNEIPNYNDELIKCQTSVADVNDTFANQAVSVNATNRNLLDNWYFVPSQVRGGQLPINRRGRTAQSILQKYFIDRWALFDGDGSASLQPGGLSLTGGQNWFRFGQQIPFWKVAGKQVTLSVLIESITDGGTFNAFLGESTGLIVNNYSPVGATSITATSAGLYQTTTILTKNASGSDNDLLNVLFRITQARTVIIKAVKLEYGSQQTLAHLEKGEWVLNEIPDYAEELLKCETNQAASTDTYANRVVSVNIPNRNLLDNAYFIGGGSQSGTVLPINQRGQTSYTQGTGLQKIFDRWQLNRGTAALTSNGVNLSWGGSSVGGTGGILRQTILGTPYSGKTVTLSLLYNGSTNGGLLTFTIPMSSSMSEYSSVQDNIVMHIQVVNSNTLIDIEVRNTTAKTLYAVKLELGTEQTLVHQENGGWVLNEIPAYRDELWACRRYLQIIKAPSSNNTISVASAGSATIMYGNIILAPMVSTPTISATKLIYGTSSLNGNVSGASFISFDNNSGFGTLQFSVASGLTTGSFYRVGIAVDTNIIFSSEP